MESPRSNGSEASLRIASPFRLLSPGGASARLSIFIFHRVLRKPDALLPDVPDSDQFDRIVRFISSNFRVMPLTDAVSALKAEKLKSAAACITFDDGYADNEEVAAPILNRHDATATFFIATGFINGGRMWNDTVIEATRIAPNGLLDWDDLGLGRHTLTDAESRVEAYTHALNILKYLDPIQRGETTAEIMRRSGLPLESSLMMTQSQLRSLKEAGHDIGGHTMNHPILARLDDAQAREEIGGGREQLAQWLGEAPRTFAYPNGVPTRDYGARDVALTRAAGFDIAVTTSIGAASVSSDVFQLPRFTPWDRSMLKFGLRCASNLVKSQPQYALA